MKEFGLRAGEYRDRKFDGFGALGWELRCDGLGSKARGVAISE